MTGFRHPFLALDLPPFFKFLDLVFLKSDLSSSKRSTSTHAPLLSSWVLPLTNKHAPKLCYTHLQVDFTCGPKRVFCTRWHVGYLPSRMSACRSASTFIGLLWWFLVLWRPLPAHSLHALASALYAPVSNRDHSTIAVFLFFSVIFSVLYCVVFAINLTQLGWTSNS